MNQNYIDTVRLLLAIAPAVFASGRFAMKGGTALRKMPRLSVDIDLVFVDHRPDRQGALQSIAQELAVVQAALARKGYRAHLPANTEGDDVKLVVSNEAVHVKVEVNSVFRGTALPIETRPLVATAQDLFTTDLAVPVLATAELYGSKLVAAMDRQHPRDIFDVMHMLDHSVGRHRSSIASWPTLPATTAPCTRSYSPRPNHSNTPSRTSSPA